jgi:UDP-N-acetylmuramyl pentapeptide phosphotransferase/UDP-N-acetylglucosamine-1-phosphate transferase
MTPKWHNWIKGLISAAIGGAANAITATIVAPEAFNFQAGLNKLLTMIAAGALLSAAMYLKQSPLPGAQLPPTSTTSQPQNKPTTGGGQ